MSVEQLEGAIKQLRKKEEKLKKQMAESGPCTLVPRKGGSRKMKLFPKDVARKSLRKVKKKLAKRLADLEKAKAAE